MSTAMGGDGAGPPISLPAHGSRVWAPLERSGSAASSPRSSREPAWMHNRPVGRAAVGLPVHWLTVVLTRLGGMR
jgi:hypothetical protein